MNKFYELKKSILADGIIDEQEVNQLREVLYEDGVIDKDEAEFLFELNDAVSGKPNHPSWDGFFVEAITDFLLKDEKSPGEVDEDEAIWLLEKIQKDGQVDELEMDLLKSFQKNAIKIHKSLVDFITTL
jgi:uncharacterized tellurite resistance protein B-like protein